jgi:alpha-glucosidase
MTWWRDAVMYEVYLRSFADGNGDGVGDLAGLRARLHHLHDLGVDGLWITPWYRSPMADGGYDVSDYRDIDPVFGTLDEARELVGEAHALGLKVIVDFVANHTSDRHPWFQAALAAAPGSPERARYHFREGRGADGAEPPNDWISAFGGPAWTRTAEPDGAPGQWYLHLFSPGQPDLNWDDPGVRADFEDILRFWFDFGLDGLRLDAASGLAKEPGLPDAGVAPGGLFQPVPPLWDVDGVHELLRSWRAIADGYAGDRMYIGEVIVGSPERLARYMRPDELHTTFTFDFLKSPLHAAALRATIDATLAAFAPVGAPATWTLSNHDETRHLTRYGRAFTGVPEPTPYPFPPSDRALGTRRARAMLLLMLALPGAAFLYQGEELGLWEVEDLPDAALQDPVWESSGHAVRGRDGCRVPLPWEGAAPPFGFGARDAWLPQPAEWRALTVQAQAGDPASMLAFYREALRLRRARLGAAAGPLRWRDAPDGVLAFQRGHVTCVVNLSGTPCEVPGPALIASAPVRDGRLEPDAATWLSGAASP